MVEEDNTAGRVGEGLAREACRGYLQVVLYNKMYRIKINKRPHASVSKANFHPILFICLLNTKFINVLSNMINNLVLENYS